MKKRWAAAVAVSMLLSLGSVMAAAADETGAVQTENTTSESGTAENGTAEKGNSANGTAENGTAENGNSANGTSENTAGQVSEADSGNEVKGTWKQEDGGWRYYDEAGTYKKNSWEQIGGYWYHFGKDGLMAVGWQKIGGYNYCFRETGDLAIGWCYNDDDEKWYNFDADGTAKKGWFQDEDGSWYWFSTRGEMASSGYKSIDGKRYYFFEDGQMAANQYVGLFYMDENGQRDKRYDIVIEGKSKESSVASETKEEITAALEHIPRGWIKYFVDHGWEILYYPDKEYFSAPESDGSTYYVYHKLDTSYRKIKFCKPEGLTQAFGEYIGYAADCFDSDSQFAVDLAMNKGNVDEFVDVPDYYTNNMQFYFGKLVEAYLSDNDTRTAMEADSPQVCEILRKVLYAR